MSKTSASGVESLKLVVQKSMKKKEAGDRQCWMRLIRKVKEVVRQHRRITIHKLSCQLYEVSESTIQRILPEKWEYRKVCAKWVPRILTEEHKRQNVEAGCEFLERSGDERDDFLNSIVTGDKLEFTTLHLSQNDSQLSGGIHLRQGRKNSNKRSLPARSWRLCFVTGRGYCCSI